ncbi:MAG TPA: hypothetical protein VKS98_03190 [Chthoniobacterales bacterium]|nr:hypothetical protein [Chthoniobacterales bacterium]
MERTPPERCDRDFIGFRLRGQNGREVHESLALHRGFRDRSDVHFSVGTHPRDWWLRTYSIVVMDGCHYYLADNGCWYPAYGFDPTCNFQEGVVYCE